MKVMEVPRGNFSANGHAGHFEVPGLLHLVELRIRSGQEGLNELHNRLLAVATLHGSIFKHGIQLWGYNILSDRVLLVLMPARPNTFSLALMNADHGSVSFWERRYSVCPFADEVAWRVLRFVDLASLPQGDDPLDPCALNSAAEHAGFLRHGLLTVPPERLPNPMAWRAFLFSHEDEQFAQALEFCLRTGRPFGPLSFVRRVEAACGRRVGSSCLKWPGLFAGGGQVPNPCGVRPTQAAAASPAMQCRSAV